MLASDAAVFLKKSGLTDLVLGKVFNDNYLINLCLASVSIQCKLKCLVVLQDTRSSLMCFQLCYPVVSNSNIFACFTMSAACSGNYNI